jgi:uncharacterized protein involved in type VI secretion and phage assembly
MPESSDSSVAATDKDRVLQLKSPFGADVVATHVSGAERLSQLFHFDLSLQSAKGDLSADKILGSPSRSCSVRPRRTNHGSSMAMSPSSRKLDTGCG